MEHGLDGVVFSEEDGQEFQGCVDVMEMLAADRIGEAGKETNRARWKRGRRFGPR
jgi:hypothetical protein